MRLLLLPYYTKSRLPFALHSSPANYENLIGRFVLMAAILPYPALLPHLAPWSNEWVPFGVDIIMHDNHRRKETFFFAFMGQAALSSALCPRSPEQDTGLMSTLWNHLIIVFRPKDFSFALSLLLKALQIPPDDSICISSVLKYIPGNDCNGDVSWPVSHYTHVQLKLFTPPSTVPICEI